MADRPVALITGASRGIGEAAARELAARGYALALAARSADALERLAGELVRSGCPALPLPTDLRRPDEVQRLARIALDHFGQIDALINNAGIGGSGVFARMPDDAIDAQLAVNLHAPIALTRALLPQMLARRSGSIVFVSSVLGRIAMPGSTIYNAGKFGLRGFALGLRREVAHRGVGVTLIAPGFIDTSMTTALRVIPKAPPEQVARAIAGALDRPRREVVVPSYYRLFVWLDQAAPGLLDLALRRRAN